MTEHADATRQSREVKTLEAAFSLDIRDVVWAYLRENEGVVTAEMQRLGNSFLKPLGDDVVAQQQPGPWREQLGVMALESAAFVVVGLATGGIGAVMLAGGQAAISVARYQALETASRANATPGRRGERGRGDSRDQRGHGLPRGVERGSSRVRGAGGQPGGTSPGPGVGEGCRSEPAGRPSGSRSRTAQAG
jgi:hypothetical protein